jgi:uracil-DNA glycosylase family 4
MAGSARVIGSGCGPLTAPLMFIGEAPGRLGADDSHLPFHGDKSGHNFESLMDQVGLSRYDVFVTNAVLCNPKDDHGNNATPTADEIRNCTDHLREQLRIVNPRIVVTLGATALRGTEVLEPHSLSLRDAVRTATQWGGRLLIPLYHPGQRAMIHRSFANQLSDYQFVVETLKRLDKVSRASRSKRPRPGSEKIASVTKRILQRKSRLTYFGLHKLLFLAEARYFEETGERLTSAYIIRQKDGPYCVELHLSRLTALLPNVVARRLGGEVILELVGQNDLFSAPTEPLLSDREQLVVDGVVEKYGSMCNADLKRVSYLASPMRRLLRRERIGRQNFFNAPLFPL